MKTFRNLLFVMTALAMTVLVSCKSDDDKGGGGTGGGGTTPLVGVMKTSDLTGFVRDSDGNPLQGVKVSTGTVETVTDIKGGFKVASVNVVEGRTVVRFSKVGFFDVVRSMENDSKDEWEVVLVSKVNSSIAVSKTSRSEDAVEMATDGGMKVKLPSDAYRVDGTDQPFNGKVKTDMLFLNPDDDNFREMMPGGDLAAVDASEQDVQLVSYGMVDVNMTTEDGKKLQLREGKEAELTFPIPESLKDKTPDEIPLWSFDETDGLWKEEGVARLENGVYVGKVKHFSWVNLDWPESRATLKGVVKDESGRRIAYQRIHVGQTTCTTNANGEYSLFVPSNTEFSVWVASSDYADYTPEVKHDIPAIEAGVVYTQDITLPSLCYLSGTIVDGRTGKPVDAIVWYTFRQADSKSSYTLSNGSFELRTSATQVGEAVLNILTTTGQKETKDITLTGRDLNLGRIVINEDKPDVPTVADGGKLYVTSGGKTYEKELAVIPMRMESIDDIYGTYCLVVDQYVEVFSGYTDKGEDPFGVYEWREYMWEVEADTKSGTADVTYMDYNSDLNESIEARDIIVNVEEKDGRVNIDARGNCFYMRANPMGVAAEVNDEMAILMGQLSFKITAKYVTRRNISRSQVPSFVPMPASGVWPVGLVATILPQGVCKGTMDLYSDGTADDVQRMKEYAQRSGLALVEEDGSMTEMSPTGDTWWEGTFFDERTGNYLFISWHPWNMFEDDGQSSAEDMYAPIYVQYVEGSTFGVGRDDRARALTGSARMQKKFKALRARK